MPKRAGSPGPSRAGMSPIFCAARRRRSTHRMGASPIKTGTSYGYRDAFAIGFDKAHTIAVWLGRPDNGAVFGLVGRQAAAPVLFDAFARLGTEHEFPAPPARIFCRAAPLRFRRPCGICARMCPKALAATSAARN